MAGKDANARATTASCSSNSGSSALRKVCVYCGSKEGANPAYAAAAQELGREIARRGLDLVYGGGTMGLMGVVARTVADSGGHVTGIIPGALLPREVCGETIGETVTVRDMHERKAAMARASDAFIALPGGFGTLEELLEMITWSQLGIHAKAIGVLNVAGYYDHLFHFFNHAVDQGFVGKEHRASVLTSSSPKELLDMITEYRATHSSVVPKESWELGYNLPTTGSERT